MGEEVPVPDVSSITEQQAEAGTMPGATASIHDDSDDEDMMGDHFGGPASPMGGMRYVVFILLLSPFIHHIRYLLTRLISLVMRVQYRKGYYYVSYYINKCCINAGCIFTNMIKNMILIEIRKG